MNEPPDIYSMNIVQLYNLFKQVVYSSHKEGDEAYEDIMNRELQTIEGNPAKVPIWYITEDWYDIHPHYAEVIVHGIGTFTIGTFMDDIDYREKRMRQLILDNEPENAFKGRPTDNG